MQLCKYNVRANVNFLFLNLNWYFPFFLVYKKIEKFEGLYFHSKAYASQEGFMGKKNPCDRQWLGRGVQPHSKAGLFSYSCVLLTGDSSPACADAQT